MKRALILVALLAAGPAMADLALDKDGIAMRLGSKPCTDVRVLAHIRASALQMFRAGVASIDGKQLSVCWTEIGEGIYFVDADGEHARIVRTMFTDAPGS